MGSVILLLFISQSWVHINQEESMLGASSEFTEGSNYGPIWATRSKIQDPSGINHSPRLLMPPVSLLKRLPSKPSSQTPPLESVSEFNSRRITRESPPTFQGTVV